MKSEFFNKLFGQRAAPAPEAPPLTAAEKVEKQKTLFESFAAITEIGRNMPLIEAIKLGDEELVAENLRKGADPNALDREGRSALWHAADGGQARIGFTLLDGGADAHFRDMEGNTLLITAARAGSTGIAQRIINKGIDINAVNKRGQTALHQLARVASDVKNVEMATLLLAQGAYIDARDNNGNTVTELALANKESKQDLLEYLEKAAAWDFVKRAPPMSLTGTVTPIKALKPVRFKQTARPPLKS